MNWIATSSVEPPKDRVIIVTGGFAWVHSDLHFPARAARSGKGRNGSWQEPARPEQTSRSWKISGMITYAIFYEEGGDAFWLNASDYSRLPPFKFWAEANNPFDGHEYVDPKPPHGLSETFEGDARRDQNEKSVEKQREWIKTLERHRDDPKNSEVTIQSMVRQISQAEKTLESLIETAERSYNPYPIPK